MTQMAAQDAYPDDMAQCYGCGRLNHEGYQLKTRWDGEETLTIFTPRPYHTAMPGFVNGGLLASLIDCHGTGSGALAAYRAAGREVGSEPAFRFVTAGLKVDYLKPTPLGPPLEIRGTIVEVKGRKVVVDVALSAGGVVCVRGQVVSVQIPESMFQTPRETQ